ncbi:MAG: DUF2007 domain-containing protein [Acidimicrobiia bacterium]|nr:DUF2007 domain-containing protein [Acidimicrobiia bacterium]MDH3397233.1 DUF2007 domain-containing protein [Acidimicrobiia bacterium]
MTPDQLIEVIECFTTAEAELARAHLAAEGIEATVAADDVGGMYPGVSFGGIRLLVRRDDLDLAKQILEVE